MIPSPLLSPTLVRQCRDFVADERGAKAIEYAMIAADIGAAVAATAYSLGTKVNGFLTNVNNGL